MAAPTRWTAPELGDADERFRVDDGQAGVTGHFVPRHRHARPAEPGDAAAGAPLVADLTRAAMLPSVALHGLLSVAPRDRLTT